jgi:hypothetical protein
VKKLKKDWRYTSTRRARLIGGWRVNPLLLTADIYTHIEAAASNSCDCDLNVRCYTVVLTHFNPFHAEL